MTKPSLHSTLATSDNLLAAVDIPWEYVDEADDWLKKKEIEFVLPRVDTCRQGE